jgi:hypothetical protein
VNIWQFGFVVRFCVSALVVAFLLAYSAHHELGLSRAGIREVALFAAALIGALLTMDFFGGKSRKRK